MDGHTEMSDNLFREFPKTPRFSKINAIVTEKLDGTNAQILIVNENEPREDALHTPLAASNGLYMFAGSRTRWVSPGKEDNYGFAGWALDHAEDLFKLGAGRHFGEWWGPGIQRGYGLREKKFSLFNTGKWNRDNVPPNVDVVPLLGTATLDTLNVNEFMTFLDAYGSVASPGFMRPEGIMIYLTELERYVKKTFDGDNPKGKG